MTNSNSERPQRLGEFGIIAEVFAPLADNAPLAFGLTDDAAVIRPQADRDNVVTADTLIEGVHFFKSDPAADIAKKALRVNLSDLAAKGARPEAYLLCLSIASWVGDDWLKDFASGLREDQERFGVSLIGGDTTSTPGPLTLSITAFGTVASEQLIRRANAKPGDSVFVSGTIGDAGAGLAILKGEVDMLSAKHKQALITRYRLPEPRVELGQKLLGLASAALDVSDGLIADLGHIADISGVGIAVEALRIPLSPAARALFGDEVEGVVRAATSGDDYEIAFTAPPSVRAVIMAAAVAARVPVTEIGTVESGQGVRLIGPDGVPLALGRTGYRHF